MENSNVLDDKDFTEFIDSVPDEYLQGLQFAFSPWQHDPSSETEYKDPEERPYIDPRKMSREDLSAECWLKLHENPHVNTSVRGKVGRLTGFGFETSSGVRKIQEAIEDSGFRIPD